MTPIVLSTTTPELTLRQFTPDDAQALFARIDGNRVHLSRNDDDTSRKYPDVASVRHSIEHPANPNKLRFGVWLNTVLVGTVNLTPRSFPDGETVELGYWMASEYTGQGLATIAAQAVCEYAKSQGYRRVVASVSESNTASRRVLEKLGFKKTVEMNYAKEAESVSRGAR